MEVNKWEAELLSYWTASLVTLTPNGVVEKLNHSHLIRIASPLIIDGMQQVLMV